MSLAVVYRRFHDKDAVLRAVFTRFFEQVGAANARSLEAGTARLKQATIPQLAAAIVSGIAQGYRAHRPLVRAQALYARAHPDPDFRKRAAALNASAYQGGTTAF